jgi:peptidoglycan hydrolase-like protein with peptidoglycan-binding domain
MNQTTMKVTILTFLLAPALLLGGASLAHAQVYTSNGIYTTPYTAVPTYTQQVSSCVALTAPLTIGVSDYLVGGQVSELQNFLAHDGLLSSTYITGYYGSITAGAVAQFQASHGISPVGVVGPATRAAIEEVSCGNISTISPAQPITPIYPINPGGPIQYNYGRPEINSLSVSYNGSNTIVTIQGSDLAGNDTVVFDNRTITGVSSNGTSLTFDLPSVSAGNYDIYVTNQYGTSNSLTYTVNNTGNCNNEYNGSYNYNTNNQDCGCAYPSTTIYNGSYNTNNQYDNNCGNSSVSVTSVNTSGYVGGTATVYGSGFTTNNNTVYIGSQAVSGVYSSNGTSLSFTIPQILSEYNGSNEEYNLYVVNGNGQTSNTIEFNINGNGNTNGQLDISYLSPTSGDVGTQITIEGSGFSSYDNTVHFGNGGTENLNSYNNGSSISFTIPSYIAPCNVSNGSICPDNAQPQYAQEVTSGSYPIYVTNENGNTSNTVYFQVY